ncbi:MAG TPA: hypothetical protein VFS00_12005, partial [Polyangiaceae bacterium]|nr:hypothetical protein [Polyangiaceae bacterium]
MPCFVRSSDAKARMGAGVSGVARPAPGAGGSGVARPTPGAGGSGVARPALGAGGGVAWRPIWTRRSSSLGLGRKAAGTHLVKGVQEIFPRPTD